MIFNLFIKFLFLSFLFLFSGKASSTDSNIIVLMYHRFDEEKYPSTSISKVLFEEHIKYLANQNIKILPLTELLKYFRGEHNLPKQCVFITIDDGFKSFYNEAWPYLKKNKIPFILFISTEPVGKRGYMSWDEIKEIDQSEFGYIGHHSHTHEYLIDMTEAEFVKDIETSSKIFKDKLGYIPSIFSYPFGEYSLYMRNYISKNFEIAFGQHSGIIDINKDKFELPRFPINEKYGNLKRFKSLINYSPLEFKNLKPEEKKISNNNNPPKLTIEFFAEQKNLDNINCYSNEGNKWDKSKINIYENVLSIEFREPFVPRRGRINCSLNDNGKWRWFGTQFTVVID